MFRKLLALMLLVSLNACYVPDTLKGFDSETWKADRFGCESKRKNLVQDFDKIRKELYGKKEFIVRNVLGKPDHEELLERSTRIYYYYFEPGAQCDDRSKMSEANRAEVRINSLGKVSEVTYKRPL
ncbi:hypothetical protein [Pontibacter arcticus]|uniref:Lipoprotein n=1 Tax=Pontibacter arcticus TaxID=2080288 RepID=A0A364RCL1_9BACT|nr:hypothetical protein [Pontibacter arcticus]RAU81997.1 hypothetical protein DP923_15065 [Pontibacter arcticus]